MDKTLYAIRELIKSALIEVIADRQDLFGAAVQQEQPETDVLLSSSEAAKLLKVSVKKIYQLTEAGVILSIRSGRKHLYDRKELIQSLKKHSLKW